jgi:hypothetical protein
VGDGDAVGLLLGGESFSRAPMDDLEWFMAPRSWRALKG